MDKQERLKVYAALSAPFPPEAIQRTNGSQTGKGYDTTGIAYQFVVNRLNETLGVGGFRAHRSMHVRETATSKGRPAFEAVCEVRLDLGEWIEGEFVVFAEAVADGGHVAMTEGDARKGAFTNGLKKAAAMFGVGKAAYEGRLDDDATPEDQGGGSTARQPPRRSADRTKAVSPGNGSGSSGPAATPETNPSESSSARITTAQLGKMRTLVAEIGQDWATFRNTVRERHGVNVEFANRGLASTIINQLIVSVRQRKVNGAANGAHS